MPLILSLACTAATPNATIYGAGPDGLFRLEGDSAVAEAQPMQSLFCCAAVAGVAGPVLLTGGAPHGAAWRNTNGDWQAGWMDYTDTPILHIAPAPNAQQSGLLLAAGNGAGILRSTNRGQRWSLCNYGLHDFVVLTLAWAPPPPATLWPAYELVFAGTEQGLYRSPAAGLGWQRVAGVDAAIQALAVSPDFHTNGIVLAAAELGGLLRSTDGGRTFAPLAGFTERVDALLARRDGSWLAATPNGVYHSSNTQSWQLLPSSPPALCLLEVTENAEAATIVLGGEFGFARISAPRQVSPFFSIF